MTHEVLIILIAGGALVGTSALLALATRWRQDARTRRRALLHEERLRAIEQGHPLAEEEIERLRALGGIGRWIALACPASGLLGSLLVFAFLADTGPRLAGLGIVWGAVTVMAVTVLPIVCGQLRRARW